MNDSSGAVIVALTTVGGADDAERVAKALVEERLAACVNRVAIDSTYRWQGRIEDESEILLVIKSTAGNREALEARVLELSSYDVPEFVVIDAASVGQAYGRWLVGECRRED